jgi:hypothetical protein
VGKHIEAVIILLLHNQQICPLLLVPGCKLCFPLTPFYTPFGSSFEYESAVIILLSLFDVESYTVSIIGETEPFQHFFIC